MILGGNLGLWNERKSQDNLETQDLRGNNERIHTPHWGKF